jgi:zonular occludens toxin Zot
VGLPGSGKTLRLVQLGLESLAQDREVYANFRLGRRIDGWLAPTCGFTGCGTFHSTPMHEPTGYRAVAGDAILNYYGKRYGWRHGKVFIQDDNVTVLRTWDDLIELRVLRDEFAVAHRQGCPIVQCNGCSKGITVLIDELNLWAPSRLWQELGIGVLNRWAYVRKDGLNVIWTAQHEARIDKVAREVTDFIWSCKSMGGVLSLGSRWKWHLQLFHRRKWIPALMTDKNRVSEGEGGKSSGMLGMDFEMSFWGGMKKAADAYDTYEHVSDAGIGERAAAKPRARREGIRSIDAA